MSTRLALISSSCYGIIILVGAAFFFISSLAQAATVFSWDGTTWDTNPSGYPIVTLSDDTVFDIQSDTPTSPTIISLTGTNSITKTGNGTLYLTGDNTSIFTGGTVVTGGVLDIDNEYAIYTDSLFNAVIGDGTLAAPR